MDDDRKRNVTGPPMDLDELNDVTGLVYEAALDPDRWPEVLGRLAGLFRCQFADRFQRRDDYSAFSGVQHGLDDADYNDVFLDFWVKRNVWGAKRPVRRGGDLVTTRDIMPAEALRRTEMYNEYPAPRGLHEGLRLDLWAGDGWIEDISMLRPWSAGPYTAAELAMARMLLPHLQRAATVARRLRSADGLAQAGLAALDRVHAAVFLLDAAGGIVHGNAAAMALLTAADGLASGAGGLEAATPDATRQLHQVLHAAAGLQGAAPESGAMRLPRESGLPPLALVALPLRRGDSGYAMDTVGAPAVLVCVVDPQAGIALDQAQMIALFGLTPSEAALATALLSGLDLLDIAAESGRSVNTLRTQLAKVMAKTRTARQSELIRLLSRLPRDTK